MHAALKKKHFVIFLCMWKGSEVTAMIFVTLMHQFNTVIDVKNVSVKFCGYAYLEWQGFGMNFKLFETERDSYSIFTY